MDGKNQKLKVGITSPTTWPYVRRGAERFINELAAHLVQQGHSVKIISGKPGATEVIETRGYVTVCHRRWWHPSFARFGLLEFHMFFFPAFAALLRERFDIVVCLTFMDAFAARLARRITSTPYVFVVNGIPPKQQYFRSLTLKGAVFGSAIRGSNAVIAISDFVKNYLEGRWGRSCKKIAVPLDTDEFRPNWKTNNGPPIVTCAAALDDRRKGGRLLMKAFNILKSRRPDLVLRIASQVSDTTKSDLLDLVSPQWRNDVHFVAAEENLSELFATSSISVLPSLWEPYGMVVLESMAAGTPVVGTRDGALPELIRDANVGRLFDPGASSDAEATNVDGLVAAMDDCLVLSSDPKTAERCRRYALGYSWKHLGPQYEQLLLQLSGRAPELQMAVGN